VPADTDSDRARGMGWRILAAHRRLGAASREARPAAFADLARLLSGPRSGIAATSLGRVLAFGD
jgi:hypothetical protein